MQTRLLDIWNHFDSYRKRDRSKFQSRPTFRHWEAIDVEAHSRGDVDGSDREEEWKRVAHVERARLSAYYGNKSLHEQAFWVPESFGKIAASRWDEYLSTAIAQMRVNRFPEITGSFTIFGHAGTVENTADLSRGRRGHRARALSSLEPRGSIGPRGRPSRRGRWGGRGL